MFSLIYSNFGWLAGTPILRKHNNYSIPKYPKGSMVCVVGSASQTWQKQHIHAAWSAGTPVATGISEQCDFTSPAATGYEAQAMNFFIGWHMVLLKVRHRKIRSLPL
jgi:hypothetical protein